MKHFCVGFMIMLFCYSNVYAEAAKFHCKFQSRGSMEYLQGEFTFDTVKDDKVEFDFIVDEETKKSYISGNAGIAEVSTMLNKNAIIIFQVNKDLGLTTLTKIIMDGNKYPLPAVHFRTFDILQTTLSHQFSGFCTK